ncbi:MAG TPA: VWA domain-containing protein [Victivallales bacterium]|nr:VWA domain-containing protein [Victivallales bacterium]
MDINNYYSLFKGFRFESPWYLLLIIPLILLIIFSIVRKKPALTIPWMKPFLGKKKRKGFNRTYIPLIIYSLASLLLIFALSRPQKGIEELIQRSEGIDIILALDLSGSMKAIDISKDLSSAQIRNDLKSGKLKERISYAKDEIKRFIKKRPNDRIGLVVFAPKSYMACPPTLDHSLLLADLDNVNAGIVGDATNIAAPIATAVSRLKDARSKRRVLVLFTDGSNNVNDRINPMQAAKLAKMYHIIIYTVGIGSPNAFVLQNSIFGAQFIPIFGHFDKKLMENIAKETGGKYYKAADAKGLKSVLDKINKLEKTTMEQPKFIDYREIGPILLGVALALFILGFILENTFFIRLP